MSATETMFRVVEQQMRPILMMALSACIGLLPAAVSTGIGSQVQRPLATVIVGGMFIGPIMLLVVVPALQSLFLERQRAPPWSRRHAADQRPRDAGPRRALLRRPSRAGRPADPGPDRDLSTQLHDHGCCGEPVLCRPRLHPQADRRHLQGLRRHHD